MSQSNDNHEANHDLEKVAMYIALPFLPPAMIVAAPIIAIVSVVVFIPYVIVTGIKGLIEDEIKDRKQRKGKNKNNKKDLKYELINRSPASY
jgi:hypothetical protein